MPKQKKALICVPVCSASVEALAGEVALAASAADLIELRLDCLTRSEFEVSAPAIKVALETGVSLIVTLRPAAEGGHRELPFSERKTFWSTYGKSLSPALLDLELDLVHAFAADPPPGWDWDRVICSHHDFRGVPAELESLYERMAATPARILKIAVQAHDAVDCLPLFPCWSAPAEVAN
jgi:3-dehydroquinate dehydratase type I